MIKSRKISPKRRYRLEYSGPFLKPTARVGSRDLEKCLQLLPFKEIQNLEVYESKTFTGSLGTTLTVSREL